MADKLYRNILVDEAVQVEAICGEVWSDFVLLLERVGAILGKHLEIYMSL